MKKQKKLHRATVSSICKALIAFAAIAASGMASVLFFGEPECPESLKQDLQ